MPELLLCNIWINSPQKKMIQPSSNEDIWFLTERMHCYAVADNVGRKYSGTMDSIIAASQTGLVSCVFVCVCMGGDVIMVHQACQ